MLLITGANGKLGRLIVDEVLRRAPDAPLAVGVRDASAADPDARVAEMVLVAQAAADAGVKHTAYHGAGRPITPSRQAVAAVLDGTSK